MENVDLILQLVLVLGLGVLAWVESRWARVPNQLDKWSRWQTNLALYLLGIFIMALVFDPFSIQAIRLGAAWGWGGLAAMGWPTWFKLLLGVLMIDLFQYALHVLAHRVPWWWRLHKVHHADTSMDASTALLHHPAELFVNSFVLVMFCAAFGVPVIALLLYAALQQVHNLFCHSNLKLSPTLDRRLRRVLVTPDMHAIHHSIRMDEGNSNFAMVFPWWDHLFASYIDQPAKGHQAMQTGIPELAGESGLKLWRLLALPFKQILPRQQVSRFK
jgi:sterol desaturase/sphingolipid hydroxylase (fatty acid hydroxylase superfamily)